MRRRVGTLTTAVALIFLGVVLLVRQIEPNLASTIFHYWPVIFILLGLEVIVLNSINKEDNIKLGFNGAIIFIVIIFLLVEGFFGIKNSIINRFPDFNLGIDIGNAIINGKPVDAFGSAKLKSNKVSFLGYNGDIKIRRSDNGEVKFEGKVYVSDNSNISNYEITPTSSDNGIVFDLKDNSIKKIEGVLFVPDNIDLKIDINNLNISNSEDFLGTALRIDSNNGYFDVSRFKSVVIDNNNGKISVKDALDVNIRSNNAKIDLDGNIENIDVQANISAVDVSNKLCKNVKISTDSGKVTLRTEDKNLDIQAKTSTGYIYINGNKKGSKDYNGSIGNGEGKVNIRTGVGSIKVEHGE